jgi:probable addiction module antidote protein
MEIVRCSSGVILLAILSYICDNMQMHKTEHFKERNLMSKNMKLDDLLKEQLQDKQRAALYLEECLVDGNIDLFKKALKDVADAQLGGVTALSREVELNRQSLYRTLSEDGNPRLDTLVKILGALGLRIAVSTKGNNETIAS